MMEPAVWIIAAGVTAGAVAHVTWVSLQVLDRLAVRRTVAASREASRWTLRVTGPSYPVRKIEAIKEVRSMFNWGLREAKEFTDGSRLTHPMDEDEARQLQQLLVTFGLNSQLQGEVKS